MFTVCNFCRTHFILELNIFYWHKLKGLDNKFRNLDIILSPLQSLYILAELHTKIFTFIAWNFIQSSIVRKKYLNCYRIYTGWYLTFQSTEWWLNVGWMATEWWRERWISVAFQPPFSDHSVDWMAGTFQWPFSQLIFWKIKLRPMRLELGLTNQRESTLTIRHGDR